MKKIYLSTGNKGKISEIKEILSDLNYDVYSKSELGINEDAVEDAETLEGNSLIKAKFLKKYTDDIVMSDDTGLFVNSLAGRPGVYSARFAGDECDDTKNRQKLLSELKDKEDRSAYFETVITIIDSNDEIHQAKGRVNGKILLEECGEHGFGYDSIFMPDGYDKSFAQMEDCEKNKISHRKRALENAKIILKGLNESSNN
ncbi:RdgB/HAM1 family non-canonical purine NTP pyrophosphatase [Finegoldia magna]|uniref:dITP/XTP pyrophosphatase n=1 Tax=Finegoldia magna ATCC 53516 TaxID=525282 RepID=D6SA37_FINMA|nr:RdgB/HAM1 family non-canonical purine NTP pyrophosphatase [Finegoldia magna]EFH92337.1 non-canonical purine NTP pyrophosphatase, RdgB/HAM1 family [Finegoldia magna ATCC 53516]